METERQLLEAIGSGDSQAMRRLYDRFSGYAMAVVLRYVPEKDDARDVMQDCFVKVLTTVRQFRYQGEGSLKRWVSRIAANCAIDWLKDRQLLQLTDEVPDDIEDDEPPEIHGVPPDLLNRLIGQLPAANRTVLNLHVFGQLTHQEIAQRLGITETASFSRLFRAKRLLREMINEYLNSQRI